MANSTKRFKIPYPSENEDPFYIAFKSMIDNLDQIHFGGFEDRNMVVYTDGNISWTYGSGIYKISIYNAIEFISPSFGRKLELPVAVSPLEIEIPVNHYLMFDLSRGSTEEVDLNSNYTVGTQLPIDSTSRIFCYHAPNHKLYFISGLVLTLGNTVSGLQPGGGSFSGDATSLQGVPISTDSPSSGEVLYYDGSQWIPQVEASGVEKTIKVPIGINDVYDSTTIIPNGAIITSIQVNIDEVYDSARDITIVMHPLVGGDTSLLIASEVNPQIEDVYFVHRGINVLVPVITGIVRVNISGTIAGAGSGNVLVKYIDNFLT